MTTLASFSNLNCLVERDSIRYVHRTANTISNALSDRHQEIRLLEWARRQKISLLHVESCNPETGELVTRYLEGTACDEKKFEHPALVQEAVLLLHRVHTSSTAPMSCESNYLKRYQVTKQEAMQKNIPFPAELDDLASQFTELLSSVYCLEKLPCHNDPCPANFFQQNGVLYLHDWELASRNDPMWDIAQFCAFTQVDVDLALSYYPAHNELSRAKIFFFLPLIYFNTCVWAAFEGKSTLYKTFIQKVRDAMQHPSFKNILGVFMSASPTTSVLQLSPDCFPDFKLRTSISTIFLEDSQQHVLLLKRSQTEHQPGVWGTPGGKCKKGELPIDTLLRELWEETQIKLQKDAIEYIGERFARVPGWDYSMHIYRAKLKSRPEVVVNPKEHDTYEWVSIYAHKLYPLIKGGDEVFDCVYHEALWQPCRKAQQAQELVFRKGNKTLRFDRQKRLILNLIGTTGSGKGTQGVKLAEMYGISHLSLGDLFRDEFRGKTTLGSMVTAFDKIHFPAYLPDEVPTGILVKRLTNPDCAKGFILDGFPRTEVQGDITRDVLFQKGDVHIPLFMDVSEEEIRTRLSGRAICPECDHQVRKFDDNKWPGFCPIEAAKGKMVKLVQREEDRDEPKVERRLRMFREHKDGVLRSMQKRDPVTRFVLDNSISPNDVFHRLSVVIQERFDRLFEQESRDIEDLSQATSKVGLLCLGGAKV